MNYSLLAPNTVKLLLSQSDMDEMNISYDGLSATNPSTRRFLTDVIKRVRSENETCSFSLEKLFVEAFPRGDGGCMLYISSIAKPEKPEKPEKPDKSNKSDTPRKKLPHFGKPEPYLTPFEKLRAKSIDDFAKLAAVFAGKKSHLSYDGDCFQLEIERTKNQSGYIAKVLSEFDLFGDHDYDAQFPAKRIITGNACEVISKLYS